VAVDRLVFRVHAIQRMFERGISEVEIRQVLDAGEVIQEYQDDLPYPSRLVLGWQGSRPIRVVAANNLDNQEIIVVTVYEPDPAQWEPEFRRKRL
jgi:hypothetical protein